MHTTMKGKASALVLSVAMTTGVCATQAAGSPAATFARGVYWPWERTQANADAAGMEFWEFCDHLMGRIDTEMNCNLIWFVNGPKDPGRICGLAAKHNLKVLCSVMQTETVHQVTDPAALARAAQRDVATIKDCPGLGGYVLKDEPRANELEWIESHRQLLLQADPSHISVVVTMTPHTEAYATRSGFPIVCADPYMFGAPRSPNIPNPPSASMRAYRACVQSLVSMATRAGKTPWVMPMAFHDSWGPWWLDERGNVVIEPGSYWHWRMPTAAEMHWQNWESVRNGCRGLFCYVLFPKAHPWKPGQPVPDNMQKAAKQATDNGWPLTQAVIHTGQPSDLLRLGGEPTDQSRALAEDYAVFAKHDTLLMRMRPAQIPVFYAETSATATTYTDPNDPDSRYGIVVNNDLDQERELTILFPPNVATVTDTRDGKALTLTAENIGAEALRAGTVTLAPGMGTILKAGCLPQSDACIFSADFSGRAVSLDLDGVSRVCEPRPYGFGSVWRVRKSDAAAPQGRAVLKRTALIGKALNDVASGKARVYLMVEGKFPNHESLVVAVRGKASDANWIKSDEFHRPVLIPGDTEAIELLLRDSGAALTGVRLWRVQEPQGVAVK